VKRYGIAVLVFVGWSLFFGCAAFQNAKPTIRTASDIAAAWCAAYNAKRAGITAEQAADQFCATEAQLRPWLDLVLAGEKEGVGKLGVQKECKP
jgi:hypothetical protein